MTQTLLTKRVNKISDGCYCFGGPRHLQKDCGKKGPSSPGSASSVKKGLWKWRCFLLWREEKPPTPISGALDDYGCLSPLKVPLNKVDITLQDPWIALDIADKNLNFFAEWWGTNVCLGLISWTFLVSPVLWMVLMVCLRPNALRCF